MYLQTSNKAHYISPFKNALHQLPHPINKHSTILVRPLMMNFIWPMVIPTISTPKKYIMSTSPTLCALSNPNQPTFNRTCYSSATCTAHIVTHKYNSIKLTVLPPHLQKPHLFHQLSLILHISTFFKHSIKPYKIPIYNDLQKSHSSYNIPTYK